MILPNKYLLFHFQINVTDVNDNPPRIVESQQLSVTENSPPAVVSQVTLDDPDDWNLGHGPPFTMNLHPKAPENVVKAVDVSFDTSEYILPFTILF